MADGLTIPVVVKVDDNTPAPPDAVCYYIIAKNGIFLAKRVGVVEAVVKVDRCPPTLAAQEPWAELSVSKLPFPLFAQILNFFKAVYEKRHTESVVILFYQMDTKEWRVEVPEQDVSPAGVRYKDGLQVEGFLKVGTIHSHCDFGAFHSGGDQHDEEHFDGLHVTVGKVQRDLPELSVSVVVNGHRFMKEPWDYLEGVTEHEIEVTENFTTSSSVCGDPVVFPIDELKKRSEGKDDMSWFARHVLGNLSILPFRMSFGKGGDLGIEKKGETIVVTPEKVQEVSQTRAVSKKQLVFCSPDGKGVPEFPHPPEWMAKVKEPIPILTTPRVFRRRHGSSKESSQPSFVEIGSRPILGSMAMEGFEEDGADISGFDGGDDLICSDDSSVSRDRWNSSDDSDGLSDDADLHGRKSRR